MKKINTLLLLLTLVVTGLSAQTTTVVDSVLWQNFETDPTLEFQYYPLGDDTVWVNFDLDGLTPDDGLDEHKQWYWGPFFSSFVDTLTGDTISTNCLRSWSWMENFAPGNRNWLITPPIDITDAGYMLSWLSAPIQCPRYMDGYSVLISKGSNDLLLTPNPFEDQVFQAAQMTAIVGNEGQSIDPNDFEFSTGYLHADGFTNWEYIGLFTDPDPDSTLLTGYLEPHSVDLSAYAGEKIYIAFVHDADDDYVLALDDILVTHTFTSSTTDPFEASVRLYTYPNPVVNNLNVLYRLEQAADVTLSVTDLSGRVIRQGRSRQLAGEQSVNLPLSSLSGGTYTLTLTVDGRAISRQFVKR
jgi:hypothetical protein